MALVVATLGFYGLQKRYGETRVLEGVDLEIDDGEYLVLVGPSGCGKSTLLRCIAGLEEITEGELRIDGRRVNELGPRDRDVAMVFQSYALYPHMTVRENMGFALRVRGRPVDEIEGAVRDAAALLGIEDLLDRLPGQLSGGQRQRVAMGRAIVRRPKVFLFDEPLSNLDASLRHHMRVELKRLHRKLGATIVHVTHDQVEALTLADRLLVLHQGVVQQFGTPRELFDRPANTFVATFIGSPSMNLLQEEGQTLGVRPTDIAVVPVDAGREARVDLVESLGAVALVHAEIGDEKIVVQVPEPVSFRSGDRVGLRFERLHRFDAQTGVRVS